LRLDSYFNVNIPTNYLSPSKKEISIQKKKAKDKINSIIKIIINREKYEEKEIKHSSFISIIFRIYPLLMRLVNLAGLKHKFYSNSKCNECKTCEKVCPSGRIKIVSEKPIWLEKVKCYMCYACFNFYPIQAVQMKNTWYMKPNSEKCGRYSHPFATASDIADQK